MPESLVASYNLNSLSVTSGAMDLRHKADLPKRLIHSYAGRRLARAILVLAAVSVLCFLFFQMSPADFFTEARLNARVSASDLAALRTQHALDRPMIGRYLYWVSSVFRGDWGFSLAYNEPAGGLLWNRAVNTLLLTVAANTVAWLIAIPFALWSTTRINPFARAMAQGSVSMLMVLPDLLLVLLFLFAAARTGLLPVGGMTSAHYSQLGAWGKITDRITHLMLPAVALALSMLPPLIEHARFSVSEVMGSTFIRAAQAHGIPAHRILFRHALPAAANALIGLLGLSVGMLLSSSLLIEAAFGWPGLGQLLWQATLERDFYVVIDAVMLSTAFLITGNLLADLLQRAVDPRIRGL